MGAPGGPPAGQAPAAPTGNGKITGVVTDSTTREPVQFATIILVNAETGKHVDGALTDEKGRFALTKIAPGEYRLQYSFIGYQPKESRVLSIEKGTELNLGMLILAEEARALNEVEVTGMANLIEEKVDRMVYNAEKDITSKGGDATDVLRKVPMLSVDLDGNVSLRGSQNILVLINNKPSTIVANSVANALRQIPADMIKSVEVITSPSARYDAEGSAGIINIITKKNTLEGATLSVDTGAGNRSANLNLNGSYRRGKMGFTVGGYGRTHYNVRGNFRNTQTTESPDGTILTRQYADTRSRGMFGTYSLGWDYDISEKSSVAANLRYSMQNMINRQHNLLTETYLPGMDHPLLAGRRVRTDALSGTVDASLTYTHIYKPQRELSILGLFSRNNRNNDFIADLLDGTDMHTLIGRQRNDNPSFNQESTIQVDYQTPIGENQMLEVGGKGIFRIVNSGFQYYFAAPGGDFIEDNSRPANTLNYDQNVTATYLSHTLTTKNKFTVKSGVRYESTFINARFSEEGPGATVNVPDYNTLVPSLNLSKSVKGGRMVKLGYNKRIQRPGIQFLNPNLNAANPTNITIGNPNLEPELTDNVELGFSGQVKIVYVNATLFGRYTGNAITSVRDTITQPVGGINTQVIQTTFQNIGRENAYGANLFINATFFSRWQIGGGGTVFHTFLTNNSTNPQYAASNNGWVRSGFVFSNVSLKKGWGIQAHVGGRGRQVQLQGYQGAFAFYSLGVKKEFNEKRGSIGISAENFFNHPFNIRTELASPLVNQQSVVGMYNAGFRINFSYRLGKMSFDGQSARKRRKSINNDDIKGGASESDSGTTQPQGGMRPR